MVACPAMPPIVIKEARRNERLVIMAISFGNPVKQSQGTRSWLDQTGCIEGLFGLRPPFVLRVPCLTVPWRPQRESCARTELSRPESRERVLGLTRRQN